MPTRHALASWLLALLFFLRVLGQVFVAFVLFERRYDPEERFQSDWYRHHRAMFAGGR
jgi:hypothetical protein